MPDAVTGSRSSFGLPAWLEALLPAAGVLLAFVFLAAWSWGKWTDVHIDFGNELYIAWQLAEGRSLYLDIEHRNGPLSHYLNAAWFQLFGVSIRTLVLCNLGILLGICAMTFRVFRQACGRLVALAVCWLLLGIFAFSQYGGIANFNYATPYQHFQTHGLALALAMILLLVEAARRRPLGWTLAAGLCLGLQFLGKAELFVPAAATAAAGLAAVVAGRDSRRDALVRLGGFGLAALVPVLGAWLLLATRLPWDRALVGVLGNWVYLGGSLASDRFYVAGAGFDDPGGNLAAMALAGLQVGFFAAACVALERFLPRASRNRWLCLAAALGLFAALVSATDIQTWEGVVRALPVATLCVAAALWLPGARRRLDDRVQTNWLGLGLWAIYALALLGKIILKARVKHYGFVLAMPATLLLAASLISLLPGLLRRRYGGGLLACSLATACIAAAGVAYWQRADEIYEHKTLALGSGGDGIVVEAPPFSRRGAVVQRTLETLEELMAPDDSLLVLPEGIAINYWLRRVNPTPYNLFLPTEVRAFGGPETMLSRIREHPPDFVVLAHRNHREFGVGPFGVDPRNGRLLVEWVRTHYESVARLGPPPFTPKGFGVEVLRRSVDEEPH